MYITMKDVVHFHMKEQQVNKDEVIDWYHNVYRKDPVDLEEDKVFSFFDYLYLRFDGSEEMIPNLSEIEFEDILEEFESHCQGTGDLIEFVIDLE